MPQRSSIDRRQGKVKRGAGESGSFLGEVGARGRHEIVPIAVFSDEAKWKSPVPDHFGSGVAGRTFNRFGSHPVKLKELDYHRFIDLANPLAFAVMTQMDYNPKEQVRLKADVFAAGRAGRGVAGGPAALSRWRTAPALDPGSRPATPTQSGRIRPGNVPLRPCAHPPCGRAACPASARTGRVGRWILVSLGWSIARSTER